MLTLMQDTGSLRLAWLCLALPMAMLLLSAMLSPAESEGRKRYYAHDAAEDANGVIAPWYKGLNGQCDWRVRIAAETLKRYPWTDAKRAVAAAPEYVFSGAWHITPDGKITIPPLSDWANGDLGQRAAYVLSGLVDYYRYTGDPAAIAHITLTADTLLDHCQTGPDHPWPNFLVSVPTKGKPYGKADPHGMIQLDITAEVGLALVRAYELTGNRRWLDAAKHWADLLAKNRTFDPQWSPWNRYANPEDVGWEDHQTGGAVFLLAFFDEVIRAGYKGRNDSIVKARDVGRAYLRDVLLPKWTVNDIWGRNYWDWPDPVQAENVTEFAVRYLMEHPDVFPNWRNDARNILTLFLNHTSVAPESSGDVYSGAWAYPESSGCCGRSLWYGPMELATAYAQYGAVADSEWAREMARRQILLSTYDGHETGVVEDNIDGGPIVAGDWFKIAHPMALKHVLGTMAWLPDVLGANRENHIMRSSSVVRSVVYGRGRVAYTTFDAPRDTVDVLRLAFVPATITAAGQLLPRREDLKANGWQARELSNGDCIVTLRHDGHKSIVIGGNDPQQEAGPEAFAFAGNWTVEKDKDRECRTASAPDAAATLSFTGNQVRLIGRVGPEGGLADVYLDGAKLLVEVDCWNPSERRQQALYYRNGLADGPHTLKVVARGAGNPLSKGAAVWIEGAQWSAAGGDAGFGEGGGPTDSQRVLFGYTGRTNYRDSEGHPWQPATEWVVRAGSLADSVAAAWWTEPRRIAVAGTPDPELYRYGAHAREFTAWFTVGPGVYHARLKFAETRNTDANSRAITIRINEREVVRRMDIAATAGGLNRAVDLVFNNIAPQNGAIAIRFTGEGGEAIVQAIEIGPGDGGKGAAPVTLAAKPAGEDGNLLANSGFEETASGQVGSLGQKGGAAGWTYLFAGPSQSYIWAESDYSIHPDWGLPVIHGGKQALRTHTDGGGHTVVYQEVEVSPKTRYVASAWVRAVDLRGRGFGTHPGDSVGLWVQEMDAQGRIVADHPKAAVTKPTEYVRLTATFTTDPAAARVRFMLDTVIGSPYNEGHVTYDDCALIQEK
jgi:hypothetical protein